MTKKKALVIEGKPKLLPLINVSPARENIDSRPEAALLLANISGRGICWT